MNWILHEKFFQKVFGLATNCEFDRLFAGVAQAKIGQRRSHDAAAQLLHQTEGWNSIEHVFGAAKCGVRRGHGNQGAAAIGLLQAGASAMREACQTRGLFEDTIGAFAWLRWGAELYQQIGRCERSV